MPNLPICLCVLLLVLAGCGGEEKPVVPAASNTPAAPVKKNPLVRQKPTYEVALKSGEGEANPSLVTWSVTVPTGGWKLTTESVLVEDMLGKTYARVYIHVEQPNPDDVVTQAQATLTGEHKDARVIEGVEFSAKEYVRGIDDPKRAFYRVVKNFKAEP